MVYVDLKTRRIAALRPTPAFKNLLGKAISAISYGPVELVPPEEASRVIGGVGGDGGELNSPSKRGCPEHTTSLVSSLISPG
jgi:hypothetical protein